MYTEANLVFDDDDYNIVKIRRDKSCSMAEVEFNGHSVLLGNTWDFHPRRYGHDLGGDFSSPTALALRIKDICAKREDPFCDIREFEAVWDDVGCGFRPDPAIITLMVCGTCRCGGSALAVHIDGDGGGLRLTESSIGIWNTTGTIEPGDIRYDEAVRIMKWESEEGYEPRRDGHKRYLDHLPEIKDIDELRREWLLDYNASPLSRLDIEWSSLQRLIQAGVGTCGELTRHTQRSMVRDLPGVGQATAMAVARAFGSKRLSWPTLREGLETALPA